MIAGVKRTFSGALWSQANSDLRGWHASHWSITGVSHVDLPRRNFYALSNQPLDRNVWSRLSTIQYMPTIRQLTSDETD